MRIMVSDGMKLDHCYIPFGRGTRMCVGQHFTQAEIYIVMAAVFWRFELRLVDTIFERDIQTVRDYILIETSPECAGCCSWRVSLIVVSIKVKPY
ncbi:hypothetical protein DTO207G8_3605 [Paecilomyces variotii]|nr:hypothetical protein DTO207G8_3605 [Paecilomyces variotii]